MERFWNVTIHPVPFYPYIIHSTSTFIPHPPVPSCLLITHWTYLGYDLCENTVTVYRANRPRRDPEGNPEDSSAFSHRESKRVSRDYLEIHTMFRTCIYLALIYRRNKDHISLLNSLGNSFFSKVAFCRTKFAYKINFLLYEYFTICFLIFIFIIVSMIFQQGPEVSCWVFFYAIISIKYSQFSNYDHLDFRPFGLMT